MTSNIRLDISLDDLCAVLAGSTACGNVLPFCTRPTASGRGAPQRLVCPVSRGRDGLAWVLSEYGIGAGDELLVTDVMCDTVGEAVRPAGARLVTYGLGPGSFTPSPRACEQAVSGRTKALIVPHLFGMPTALANFAALAEEHDLLLIEDSALVFPAGEHDLESDETPAACVIYSFNYGKPLAVGWGGLVSLSPGLAARLGPPPTAPMDEDDDRFYAAALLLGHAMTDPGRRPRPVRRAETAHMPGAVVHADVGLHLLVTEGGGDGPGIPDRAAVDAVFEAAEKGPDAVLAWCDRRATGTRRPRRQRLASFVDASEETETGPMDILRPGGYSQRLLELQWRLLREGVGAERRRATAAFYAANLDPSRWTFPEADQAAYWLSYPAAARRPVLRDHLVRTIVERLAVDVHPYVWPDVLHRIPSLRCTVIAGPGCEESARLVDGLLNLPVHEQLSRETAKALVGLLNDEG